jgi:hypothetical protein
MYNVQIISHILKIQHLDLRLHSTFVDGGVHPRFGTRNFTLRLQNGNCSEVVCPPDHPVSDTLLFSKAVSRCKVEGGSWLTWVASVDDVAKVKKRFRRQALDGHRKKLGGNDLGTALGSAVEVIWLTPADIEGGSEILDEHLMTPSGIVKLD